MRRLMIVAFCAVCTIPASFAERAIEGCSLDQSVGASYNPLGAQSVSQFFYRIPLFASEDVLWESTKVDVGIVNTLSPAYDLVGVFLKIEPIAVFSLALTAQLAGFYDALGFGFYGLSGYEAGFDAASLKALTPRNTGGFVLSAAPTFKMAIGPVAALDTFSLTYFNVDGGSGYFFERVGNLALGKSDVEFLNQAYVLATIAAGLRVGVNDSLLWVPASGYVSHRLAAMGVYQSKLQKNLSFAFALMLGGFLADKYYHSSFYAGGQAGVTMSF